MKPPLTSSVPFSQVRRSAEHVAPLGFVFSLTLFPLWLIFVLAILAVVYGLALSRHLSQRTFRPEERQRGYSMGKIAYAISVFFLLVFFHKRMHIVAGAWSIMALGDASATLIGMMWGRFLLPWNKNKSWAGLFAFFLAGTAGSFLLMWYTVATGAGADPIALRTLAVMAMAAAGLSAVVESLPVKVNDNFRVPAAAGVTLYLLTRLTIP